MLEQLKKSEFLRSVLVLLSGTAIAQLLGYAIYPILTKLYDSNQFGDMYLYMRIVAFASAVATVRYELTLPLAKQELHAFHLYRLSFRIALVVLTALAITGVLYVWLQPQKGLDVWFLLLTIGSAYLSVWINLGTNWSVRVGAFKRISRQRIVQSLTSNGLKVLFGWFSWGSIGLILSMFTGALISVYVFVLDFLKLRQKHKGYRVSKRMSILSKQYRDYPLLNFPHVLLELGADLVIASLLLYYYGKETFGYYGHAFAMLKLPLGIIGQSIGQVFMNRCSELKHSGKSILPLLRKTMLTLLLLSVVPFTLLFFFGEPLFGFVFGKDWTTSGHFATIMAPWIMLNFVLSPVSAITLVLNRQKEAFLIGLLNTCGQLAIFGLLPWFWEPVQGNFSLLLWIATGFLFAIHILAGSLYLQFARKVKTA